MLTTVNISCLAVFILGTCLLCLLDMYISQHKYSDLFLQSTNSQTKEVESWKQRNDSVHGVAEIYSSRSNRIS